LAPHSSKTNPFIPSEAVSPPQNHSRVHPAGCVQDEEGGAERTMQFRTNREYLFWMQVGG